MTEVSSSVYDWLIDNLRQMRKAELAGGRPYPQPPDYTRFYSALHVLIRELDTDELVSMVGMSVALGVARGSQTILADWELKPSAMNRGTSAPEKA
jgi:hypothetical protein